MRVLIALGFAYGALAIAIGPVQFSKSSLTVDGKESSDLIKAVVTHEIAHPDEELSSSKLNKRVGRGIVINDLQIPHRPNPEPVILAGVTVSFIMASRYVRVQGTNILQYYVKNMSFHNQNAQRVAVEPIANGINFFSYHLSDQGVRVGKPPDGAATFKLSIEPVDSEL
ncbi:hypothetical protein E4U13_003980 [Claviceps humidiphila]|uniref:Uncharacterized protein n=1 Tax=Claviceps humidiphila TaxID=1294629 RepID=A0A9P7TS16_9HYPO|nr:hypothetical protein E4U13_003980 [Claviceps humidiphila]